MATIPQKHSDIMTLAKDNRLLYLTIFKHSI
nr:MAG TPA: hypothetical protein [Caudoviricetes sp.]